MFDFVFENITDVDTRNEFNSGIFIWVFHADKIPPHIGISVDDKFFSLKSSGVDIGLNTNKVLSVISKKEIPSFIVEVADQLSVDTFYSEFEKFNNANAEGDTCLTPVRNLLRVPQAQKLSELLQELHLGQRIGDVFRLNSDRSMIGIRSYSPEDIKNRLLSLENQFA